MKARRWWNTISRRWCTRSTRSAQLDRAGARLGRRFRYHLKIDSGMGRLGTRAGAEEILGGSRANRLCAAGRPDDPFRLRRRLHQQPDRQPARVLPRLCGQLARGWRRPRRTCTLRAPTPSATAARDGWHNMVRAGHALYGYVSPARGEAPRQLLDVQPALTWKAKLLAVKEIPGGRAGGLRRHASARRDPCASAFWARATPTACFTGSPTAARSSPTAS